MNTRNDASIKLACMHQNACLDTKGGHAFRNASSCYSICGRLGAAFNHVRIVDRVGLQGAINWDDSPPHEYDGLKAIVNFFAWIATRNKLWTADCLGKRGWLNPELSPLCEQTL